MSTFKIKSYGKSEFAWLMFPKMKDPSSAQDKLLRWIKKNPRFHKRLLRLANTKDDNNYSKEQIQRIIDKFGEPGEYDDYYFHFLPSPWTSSLLNAQPIKTHRVSRDTKTQNFLAVSAKRFLSPCPGEG